jgi:hypothetical protein
MEEMKKFASQSAIDEARAASEVAKEAFDNQADKVAK